MFVSEIAMNKVSRVLMGLLLIAGVGMAHAASDDDKLRELERAMTTPSEPGMAKPRMRTRAIVFDNQPQTGGQAEAPAQAAAAPAQYNCSSLPPDVRTVGVDFAIQFNVGSATISGASEGTLSQIAKVLALSPDRCVIVEGHTDVSGNFDKNMALSRDRAASVVNFISSRHGVDRKRLAPVGKGSTEIMQNLDAHDPKNRRVVFKVVTG